MPVPGSSSHPAEKRRTWRMHLTSLPLILVVGSGAIALCMLVATIRLMGYGEDTTYPESGVALTGLWAAQTGHLYPNIEQSPYTPAPYGPLFYLGLETIVRFAGSLRALILFGRGASFACFLGISLLAYRICCRFGLPRQIAVLAGLFILGQHMYFRWTATLRPDLAALMLTAIALYLITQPRVGAAQVIFSGFAMGLALSVKQTFVALPFAVGVWFVLEKRFRNLLLLAVACVIPVGALIGILSLRGEPVL